jgi:rhamnulokinase
MPRYIAIDLGAESGRVMLGTLDQAKLRLEEIHRFPNLPMKMENGLHWNIPLLWSEIQSGIGKAVLHAGGEVDGISTDSWGVDYVLMKSNSQTFSPPFIYRDPRQAAPYERLLRELGAEYIFAQTGIQLMAINTLYQLCAEESEVLRQADAMLLIGDYFNHLIAGSPQQARSEMSLASTTQLLNVETRQWAEPLIPRAGLPRKIFTPLVDTGTKLGPSQFLSSMQTIATCSHDTGCAVAAVPADLQPGWAYISSGTWSLEGVELDAPIVNDRCRALGFTNELGVNGTTRLLKNISGLYMLQQCRAMWKERGADVGYAELALMAEKAVPVRSLIRPETAVFGIPGDMPKRITEYCKSTEQPEPRDQGEFARCIYESLALLYRKTLLEVQELTGHTISRLHIVGGGSRSSLLNQSTADACGIPVMAGPVEATSMGNVLIQAQTLGHIAYGDIRKIVRASCSPETFEPKNGARMQEAFERFLNLPVN